MITVYTIFGDEFVHERRSRANLLNAEDSLIVIGAAESARGEFAHIVPHMGHKANTGNPTRSVVRISYQLPIGCPNRELAVTQAIEDQKLMVGE